MVLPNKKRKIKCGMLLMIMSCVFVSQSARGSHAFMCVTAMALARLCAHRANMRVAKRLDGSLARSDKDHSGTHTQPSLPLHAMPHSSHVSSIYLFES